MPKKIGVVAISLGGYYSPRCASMEPRFAACIAWGAIWDYYATWKKRIDAQFKASLSVPGHHIMWILGVDTLDEALKKLEPFRLDGVVQKMRCPFLLVHGADDEQIPLADAQALFDACGSKDKTFRVFTAEEGGAQHCQRDYLTLGVRRDVELVRGQAAAGVIGINSSAASSVFDRRPTLRLSPRAGHDPQCRRRLAIRPERPVGRIEPAPVGDRLEAVGQSHHRLGCAQRQVAVGLDGPRDPVEHAILVA